MSKITDQRLWLRIRRLSSLRFVARELRQIVFTIGVVIANRAKLQAGLYYISGRVALHRSSQKKLSSLLSSKGGRIKILWPLISRGGGQALCRANPDALIFFYVDERLISRIEPYARYSRTYRDLRTKLQKSISGPDFKISDDGVMLSESMHAGEILATKSHQEKYKFTKKVIDDLILSKAYYPCSGALQSRESLGVNRSFSITVIEELNRYGLATFEECKALECFPEVPSHGDLGPHHILIDGENYLVIDWDYELVSVRPVWYDILSLFESDAFLRRAFVEGAFDEQLLKLSLSTKCAHHIELLRKLLPLAWSVSFCSKRPMPTNSERDRVRRTYLERWSKELKIEIPATA